MATIRTRRAPVNLGVTIDGKTVFATPTGLKLGSDGRVTYAPDFLRSLPKSDRRKIRKSARVNRMMHIATS